MNKIIVENICKSYKNKKILKEISFELEEGKIYGFVGPNGAGKTTTLKILLGLIKSDSGEIKYNDKNIQSLFDVYPGKIGAIINSPSFYGDLTARENLKIVCNLKGCSEQDIDRVLEIVRLNDVEKLKCKKYSMGMKQRLAIAQAIIGRPDFLVLDEPINGLDPQGIFEMRELFLKLKNEYNTTIIISSHLLGELEQISDNIIVIDHGKIMYSGNIGELKKKTGTQNVEQSYFEIIKERGLYD